MPVTRRRRSLQPIHRSSSSRPARRKRRQNAAGDAVLVVRKGLGFVRCYTRLRGGTDTFSFLIP